jgi:hypothetical protein
VTFLLDVNLLIALVDPSHVSHEATLDRRLSALAVKRGAESLFLVGA